MSYIKLPKVSGTVTPGGATYAEVNTFADLPAAASHSGEIYVVITATKILWLVNWHNAGFYRSNGSSWDYLGPSPETTSIKAGVTTVVGAPVELVAGTNVTLTPDASAKTITIASSPGTVGVANGGTGATTALGARQNLGAETVFNGLEDPTKFTVTYDASTRVFTITYGVGGAAYTVGGVRYTKAAGSETTTAHANTTGLWYLYFDSSGVLTVGSVAWDLLSTAPIAALYYTTSNNGGTADGILIDERHPGIAGMDDATHKYLHSTIGTRLQSGCAITAGTYASNTNSLAAITPGFDAGTLADEDIYITATAVANGGPYRVAWKTGSAASPSWNWSDSFTTPFWNDATQIGYNQNNAGTYQMTAITTNLWVNVWIVSKTAYSAPQTVFLMGENQHASLAVAQAANFATDCTNTSKFLTEGVVLYRLTYRRAGGGATWFNCQLVDVAQVTAAIITSGSGAITAASVSADTTNFNGNLSTADTTVQAALDTLDNLVITVDDQTTTAVKVTILNM